MKLRHAVMFVSVLAIPSFAHSQEVLSDRDVEILRLLATPFGALPPTSLPMAASRNHNYWQGRIQGGYRTGPNDENLSSIGGGIDLQYRGGSVFGLTAGYQKRNCTVNVDCESGHMMYGARAKVGLVTGGSTMAGLLHDNSTTSTFGTEIGFGYAPNVAPDVSACTLDFGIPYSIAKRRQRPRFVTYITPGMVWDIKCGSDGPGTKKSYFTGFGLGLQQVGNRSLDIYLGVQKIYRAQAGTQFGVSITYVRLP
jgi:hypothetical protein